MSRRRGRDACGPATARRWKAAALPSESPDVARRRIAMRQLRPAALRVPSAMAYIPGFPGLLIYGAR